MRYSVKMKQVIISVVLALAGLSLATAQETGPSTQPESNFDYEPIRAGDQYIRMGLGAGIPLFNMTPDGIERETNLNLGGTGSIGYSRYLNSKIAVGGEITFAFNTTIGGNMFFYLPLTFKSTYEFVYRRFHFPVSLGAGFAFQTHNANYYFGPMLKPELGAYWKYSPDWSFGMTAAWSLVPQWYTDSEYNRTGNFLDINAGFRYHF